MAAITTAKIADGAITSAKINRRITKSSLANTIALPNAWTWYDVLQRTVNPDSETLLTIHTLISPQKMLLDGFFATDITVDGVTQMGCNM